MSEEPTWEDPEDRLGMTEQQWEWFKQNTRGFGEQDEHGIDLSQLRENLKLTPTERFRKHQRALRNMLEVRRAGQRAGLGARPERSRG